MNRFKKQTAVLLLAALSLTAVPTSAVALDLGDILKKGALIVGGGALVKALAEPLNDFINTVTFNRNAKFQGYTKVVPIVSIGDGTHIGAAQVGGQVKSAVERRPQPSWRRSSRGCASASSSPSTPSTPLRSSIEFRALASPQ